MRGELPTPGLCAAAGRPHTAPGSGPPPDPGDHRLLSVHDPYRVRPTTVTVLELGGILTKVPELLLSWPREQLTLASPKTSF